MANYNLFDAASLAMVPTGVKDGKLYSVKPDDGSGDFTFSRGADWATRVNADGLIEKERTNQILKSNSFNTTWTVADGSITSGQSGYDGSNDAWQLTTTSTAGSIFQLNTFSGVQTFSFYVKGDGSTGLRMYAFGSVNNTAFFDLNNGLVNSSNTIDANIEQVGATGWYRCSITYNQTNTQVRLYTTNAAATTNSPGTIFIQDAQVESGLVATDYIETTTAPVSAGITDDLPRIDYSSGCGSLLLEPSRTNKFLYSEYYGSGGLSIYATGTNTYSVTNNYAVSPEGVQNAIRFVADVTSANDRVVLRDGVSCGGGNHTLTFYAKSNTTETYTMKMHFDGSGKKQIEVTPEWQRFEYGESANTICNAGIECSSASGYSASVDVSVYGFQLEENLYPTSYIPTYGSSVTRSQEGAQVLSVSNLIGQTQGTLFAEVDSFGVGEVANRILGVSNGTSAERVIMLTRSNGFRFIVTNSSVNGVDYTKYTTTEGVHKLAMTYDANEVRIFVDGVKVTTDSSVTLPSSLNSAHIGKAEINHNYGNNFGGSVKQSAVFPTALTDSECKALTRPYDTYQEWVDGEGLTWESKSCTVQNIVELQNL